MPKWSQIEKGQTCQIEANCSQTGAKLKTVRWGTPPGPMGYPPLGRLLAPRLLLGASWTPLGRHLGQLLGRLGASWWRTWLQQGPQNEAQLQ